MPKRRNKTPIQNSQGGNNILNNRPKYDIANTESRWKKIFNGMINLNANYLPMGVGMGAAFGNNPFISNSRIKNLQTPPRLEERTNIENALLDPGNNELSLRGNTHSVLNQTYPLYRLQYLYEGILTYKYYVQPLFVDKKHMATPRFKSDEKFTDLWLKKLNPKKTFRRIVAQIMAEGKKSYILRHSYNKQYEKENVDYVMLQDVPSDWFKITSITSNSYYGISFDFFYFMTPGADIRQFPPFFKNIYMELMGFGDISPDGSITIDINKVAKSENITAEYNSTLDTWAYWAELPANIVWTFCFTEADALAVSPFISLLLMGSDLTNYSLLQQQLVSAPLNSLILGEMITNTETKYSGWSPDNFFISPEALNMFENSINSVLANANIAYKMTPSVKNQMFNVPSVPNAQNVYNEAIRGIINTAGSGALQTLSEKPSVAQTNMARITEHRFIDRIYAQFEHFVNSIFEEMYNIGDLSFKWYFRIFGNSYLDKDEIADLEKSLSMGQMELLPRYLALRDLTLSDANTLVDYVESTGIYDKFKPLVSSYTMKTDTFKETGRPPVDNPENDNTDASKNLGASDARNEE